MQVKPPSKEEFHGWLGDPVTQAFMEYMRRSVLSLQDQWSNGVFISSSTAETARMNVQAVGKVQQLNELLNLDVDQIKEVLKDD